MEKKFPFYHARQGELTNKTTKNVVIHIKTPQILCKGNKFFGEWEQFYKKNSPLPRQARGTYKQNNKECRDSHQNTSNIVVFIMVSILFIIHVCR
jgi:hypothetical protein